MKALIDRSTGIATPNFGIHTREPLTYFIDIIEPGVDRRFVCPVNVVEFETYCSDVIGLSGHRLNDELYAIDNDCATDDLANFLNEKSKDWVEVDQNNEPITLFEQKPIDESKLFL